MGNNAAAAAFAAEQERIQAEQLAAQLRAEPLTEAQKLFPTLSKEEAEAWNQQRMSIDANGSGRSFGGLFEPVQKTFETFAKLPGTPEALATGLEAGASGDASWNPYSKDGRSVWDIGAGGTELSQNENIRDAGRAIGTAVGGAFAGPALSGAMGGGATGAAGAGAVLGGGQTAIAGGNLQDILKSAALGGATALAGYGIKSYLSTDGTIKKLDPNLGDHLPTDFADIPPGPGQITDFPELLPESGGVPNTPAGSFPGFDPSEFAGYDPGYYDFPDSPGYGAPVVPGFDPKGPIKGLDYDPAPETDLPGAPPADQSIDVTGKIPDGTGGFTPLPPMYNGDSGPIPEGPQPVEPIELAPEKPLPDMPKPAPNYGKLISSLLGNFLSTGGGSSGGGSRGYDQDKLARSLRQPSEPVTMTNPNYIPR
jgi:hypothetical protein